MKRRDFRLRNTRGELVQRQLCVIGGHAGYVWIGPRRGYKGDILILSTHQLVALRAALDQAIGEAEA